jgi:hypothetical protein
MKLEERKYIQSATFLARSLCYCLNIFNLWTLGFNTPLKAEYVKRVISSTNNVKF